MNIIMQVIDFVIIFTVYIAASIENVLHGERQYG